MDLKTISISLATESGLNAEFVAKFALFLAIILLTTIMIGKLLKMSFKLPIVAGQIIGGIILGPSFLKIQQLKIFQHTTSFLDTTKQYICNIASTDFFLFFILLISSAITVSYLLWLAGHETNIKDMAKVGLVSTLSGAIAAIMPIIMITATFYFLDGYCFNLASSIGQGVVFAATSVSIPITMLISYGKMDLRSSKATIGAAIIDDILAIILFSIFIILLQNKVFGNNICNLIGCKNTNISIAIIKMVLSFLAMFLIGTYLIKPVNKFLWRNKFSHLIPSFATLMMLSYFSLAELFGGLAGITGAYFSGLFHKSGDQKHKAVRAISPFVNAILLPLFLGSIGMQVNITSLTYFGWVKVIVILIVAILSKLVGCYISTSITNIFIKRKNKNRKKPLMLWSFWESFLFGSSMVARGEVGLVIATILNGTNLLTPEQYIICVAVIILTTIASPILLLTGFKQLKAKQRPAEYTVKIGTFHSISMRNLFDVISSYVEKTEPIKPIIALSEGNKILTLRKNTKIILNAEKNIVFKGDEEKIKKILNDIKNNLIQDIEKIPSFTIEELQETFHL